MTKNEFVVKWGDYMNALPSTRQKLRKDLTEVVKEETNPLCRGIVTAIFELEQAYKEAGKERKK